MSWVHPLALFFLFVSPVAAVLLWGTTHGRRQIWISALGTGCISAAVIAVARPVLLLSPNSHQPTILVVDLSPSAGDGGLIKARELLNHGLKPERIVLFSNRAELLPQEESLQKAEAMRPDLDKPLWLDDPAGGGSCLAGALQLAGSQISDQSGKIVLVSNGLQTRGDAESEAHRLAGRNIAIQSETIDVTPKNRPVIAIHSIRLQSSARSGETIPLQLAIEASEAKSVSISMNVGSASSQNFTRSLAPGMNWIDVPVSLHETGYISVKVQVDRTFTISGALFVTLPNNVLLVSNPSETAAAEAFAALLGDSAKVSCVSPDETTEAGISSAATILLNDVPVAQLPPPIQRQMLTAVAHGTGLLVCGAARAFGPGGYADSSLAPVLPVTPAEQLRQTDPSVSVVLIVDTSGSMYGEKLALCKEMCRLVISHLHPQDKVGVIEFFGGMRWVAPIQAVGDGEMLNRVISRFTAGGDNKLYPAIEEAGEALENIETRSKHILVMSDGDDEVAPFATLAQSLSEQGINISAAATMPDPGERNVMPDVARWGRGRLYTVPDRFNIPDIKFKEPKPSQVSPLVLIPTAVSSGNDALMQNLNGHLWPALGGYVRTNAKPMSDVLLQMADGSPLLSRWQSGTGQVAALTTQIGSALSENLQNDPAFGQLMADLLRQLASQSPAQPLNISTVERPAGTEVAVKWSGQLSNAPQNLHMSLEQAGQPTVSQDLICTSVGNWNALFTGLASGDYRIKARTNDAIATAAVTVNAPRPFPKLSKDQQLLDRLTNSMPSPQDQATAARVNSKSLFDLDEILIPLVALLLILYVAARRWPVGVAPEVI